MENIAKYLQEGEFFSSSVDFLEIISNYVEVQSPFTFLSF